MMKSQFFEACVEFHAIPTPEGYLASGKTLLLKVGWSPASESGLELSLLLLFIVLWY